MPVAKSASGIEPENKLGVVSLQTDKHTQMAVSDDSRAFASNKFELVSGQISLRIGKKQEKVWIQRRENTYIVRTSAREKQFLRSRGCPDLITAVSSMQLTVNHAWLHVTCELNDRVPDWGYVRLGVREYTHNMLILDKEPMLLGMVPRNAF